jgi:hypothetical protein
MFKVAFILSIFLIFPACKKADNPPKPLVVGIKATINGLTFTGSNCTSEMLIKSLFIVGGNFTDSSNTNLPNITLIINTNGLVSTGAFPIDENSYKALIDSTPYLQLAAVEGTINIISASPDIVGTFSFTCSDSTKVTNGSFIASHY